MTGLSNRKIEVKNQITDFMGNQATSKMVSYKLNDDDMQVELFDEADGSEGEDETGDGKDPGSDRGKKDPEKA